MNQSKIIIKNSSISLLSQIVSISLEFLVRTVFIKYIGIEILGLNNTFASVLNTLSLAELGFQSAVVYNLYKPLAEDDKEMINKIVNIYKRAYRCIGIVFIAVSVCCIPFLQYIITGIEVTGFVRGVFLLQALCSACTYFIAYKRSLLYADQHAYLSVLVDMCVNIMASILQIILIIITQNYIAYLIVKLTQVIISNLIVHWICSKRYSYLHSEKTDKALLKKILGQVKEVFVGKIGGYVYSSTDNLLISAFVGTIQVGFYTNYTMITGSLNLLVSSITSPIAPTIGNLIAEDEDGRSSIRTFNLYNYIRFLLAGLIVLPFLILINDFITAWIGSEYLLTRIIPSLLAADLYISIVHSSCCDYISGSGLFRIDKYISLIGAGFNLFFSIFFVRTLGITGVLIGTVISQIIFWVLRSLVTYRFCFKESMKAYLGYWGRQVYYFIVTLLVYAIQLQVYTILPIKNLWARFFVGAFVCECIFMAVSVICCCWTKEEKDIFRFLKNHLNR